MHRMTPGPDVAPSERINWTLDATIELTITVREHVMVLNQAEAGAACDRMTKEARERYPHAYIGCGVVGVKMAKDE